LLAWPATTLHLKNSTVADLPQSLPSVAGYERLTAAFPDQRSSVDIVAKGSATDVATVVARIRTSISGNPVFGADPELQTAGDTSVLSIAVPYSEDSDQARSALHTVRTTVIPQARQGFAGVQVAVGGSIAGNVDYLDHLTSGAPLVIGFVLLTTFLLMTLSFRSVVVGLVTIAANLLSAGAAFGVLALVFQSRWGADLLGFHLSGGVIAWIPVFLFVILFGLSMDYHVLVISRIKDASDRGLHIRDAVREGITGSASVITSAAAVMIGVFAIFAGLHMVEFKELGVGLGVAVFLDVIVVRVLILPALMLLLGRANWWAPRFLTGARLSRRPGA
jgi:putative drug exporter of the RND superfamily